MIQYKLIHPNAKFGMGNRKTDGSVGYDLYTVEGVTITPERSILAHTGVCLDMTDERIFDCETNGHHLVYGQLVARSSLYGNYAVQMPNGVGIIDNDYQGEILVPLIYCGYPAKPSVVIPAGTAIAQIVFQVAYAPLLKEASGFDNNSQRGAGGFGSTTLKERTVHQFPDTDTLSTGFTVAQIKKEMADIKKVQERTSYLEDHY